MAIFGSIESELIIQENEKIRIDVSESYVTQDEDAILSVEIEPHTGDGFITVSGVNITSDMWYLDWKYLTAGTKAVTLKITLDAPSSTVQSFTKNITVVTSVSDSLFATDDDLSKFEPDVHKWLPAGYSTWNFVHRKVQDKILTEIYKSRIFATDGSKLTKAEIIDKAEVREWATFQALAMIFMGISNAANDVFSIKSEMYSKKTLEFMNYSLNVLAVDYNKDAVLASSEKADFRSGRLIRR